jgi:drug/metabolite transporter (DMT)-like permease
MILARFVLGEAMGPWQIIGSLIAMLGMVVIVVKGSLAALIGLSVGIGDLLVVVAAIFLAIYTVFLRRAKFEMPRLQLLVVLLCAGVVAVSPFYLYELVRGELAHLDMRGYLSLAYAAIPGGALMYFLYNWSIDALGASKAGVFIYTQMVFIAILAYLILGERIELYHIIGAGLIILGVVLVMALQAKVAAASKA